MADFAVNSPKLDPRSVISTLAFGVDASQLVPAGITVQADRDGWTLFARQGPDTKAALETFWQALKIDQSRVTQIGDEARLAINLRPIGEEIIGYLTERDFSNEADAQPVQGEKLVVVPNMSNTELISLLDRINAHATVCRAAVFDHASGTNFILLHLRDDPARGSTLRLFLDVYRGPKAPVLNAYATEAGTIFLPMNPPRESLVAIAHLVDRVPALFGRQAPNTEGWRREALLFAVARASDLPAQGVSQSETWFNIQSARFFGSAAFLPDRTKPALIRAEPTAEPAASIDELNKRLSDPNGKFAHPLRLRESRDSLLSESTLVDLNSLENEKRVLDLRIRNLRASVAQQSMMLVAGDAQFAAVADLLRRCLAAGESWEGVRYQFCQRAPHANEPQTDNVSEHVFYFAPVLAQNVSLHAGLRKIKGVDLYWGDPNWTAVYGSRAKMELLVPFKSALYPLPHSWEVDEIDRYLRGIVRVWSANTIEVYPDERCILAFSNRQWDPEQPIGVRVFRDSDLAPLHGKTIRWFNAVLAQLAERGDRSEILAAEQLASDSQLAARHEARMAEIRAETLRGLEDLHSFADQALAEFQQSLDAEVAKMLTKLQRRSASVHKLQEQIEEVDRIFAKMRENLGKARGLRDAFADEMASLAQSQAREFEKLAEAAAQRDRALEQVETLSRKTIDKLKTKLSQVTNELFHG